MGEQFTLKYSTLRHEPGSALINSSVYRAHKGAEVGNKLGNVRYASRFSANSV
jgi:hypothetical protein